MKRRTFIKNSSLTALSVTAFGIVDSRSEGFTLNQKLRVNEDRIENRIFELAKYGRDENGRGYRVAYSKGDIEGRAWFMQLMENAGLEVSIDSGGNILGKRKGKNPSLKTIAFGSHIDMVPDGGDYDGTLGSLVALEVIEVLNENKIVTDHPLEIIIFSNEEGGTFGSKALVGKLTTDNLKLMSQSGLTIAEGIKAISGDTHNLTSCIRNKEEFLAFVELHIEQGGILDKENIRVGVVEGIVGIDEWDVTVEGFANHAGTTPMNLRKDAMLSAAKLIIACNEVISSHKGKQVGTVGKISAQPGAYNVVPGKAVFGLEIRDLSQDKIRTLFQEIEKRAAAIAAEDGTTITFNQILNMSPALSNKAIQDKIVQSAKELGLTYKNMQSGAGHDSQQMATIAPMGMIFVPSVGGISHSPKEFTKAADIANGANVLLQTIMALDRE
ncbi:Zn-dependent hydrolase [Pararhodonellum marinum]|uniref:Zn-dependent hydrolase n=1 Tax=Pararhodonellum marinum TaxID=2755358 RepID=UPI001890191F|nr:Zn-dependent hydrolase [Pararhodonellum marinum]